MNRRFKIEVNDDDETSKTAIRINSTLASVKVKPEKQKMNM
jgi:hypothetical protein